MRRRVMRLLLNVVLLLTTTAPAQTPRPLLASCAEPRAGDVVLTPRQDWPRTLATVATGTRVLLRAGRYTAAEIRVPREVDVRAYRCEAVSLSGAFTVSPSSQISGIVLSSPGPPAPPVTSRDAPRNLRVLTRP